jgi:hypothetical protein
MANTFLDILAELSELQQRDDASYKQAAKDYWDSLSTEEQMMCFYYVIRNIVDAELKVEHETYRSILYDRFGFPPESYGIGLLAGFMELHNSLERK